MGRFPAHRFKVAFVNDADYLDVELIDTLPKGELRTWRISRDDNGQWYGMLRRSATPEDPFEDGTYLPKLMVDALVRIYESSLGTQATA
jgi:hypothetical protein